MRIAIDDAVIPAAGDEDAGRFVVVDIQAFEHIVRAPDTHAPGILPGLELLHAAYLEAAQVYPVALHVEARHSSIWRAVREIEHGGFALVCEVADRIVRGAAL